MLATHFRLVLLAFCSSVILVGCGNKEKEEEFRHELLTFAIVYHSMAENKADVTVENNGFGIVNWKSTTGPKSLDDMRANEPAFQEVANRIRNGTFRVVWKANLQRASEENGHYYLGHEVGIEEKGGWVLMAGGMPEKITSEQFKSLQAIPVN